MFYLLKIQFPQRILLVRLALYNLGLLSPHPLFFPPVLILLAPLIRRRPQLSLVIFCLNMHCLLICWIWSIFMSFHIFKKIEIHPGDFLLVYFHLAHGFIQNDVLGHFAKG